MLVEDFQKGITSMQININWKDSRNPIPQVRKKGPVVYLSYPGLEETGIVRQIGRASCRERVCMFV